MLCSFSDPHTFAQKLSRDLGFARDHKVGFSHVAKSEIIILHHNLSVNKLLVPSSRNNLVVCTLPIIQYGSTAMYCVCQTCTDHSVVASTVMRWTTLSFLVLFIQKYTKCLDMLLCVCIHVLICMHVEVYVYTVGTMVQLLSCNPGRDFAFCILCILLANKYLTRLQPC